MTHELNGKQYERASALQQEWGRSLIAELELQGTERVLDLGCGEGTLTARMAELVPRGDVVGVDASEGMIALRDMDRHVFLILARKAGTLRAGTILAGWLLRTTRYTAANARRREQRRQHFEREAMNRLQSTESDAAWERIAPLLDDALCRLSENDRAAIALRFFQQKSFKEVGAAVSLSENSARMRVTRALERLRRFFARRSITLSVLTLGAAMSANAVQAAPPGLAASVSVAAVTEGAEASVSVAALVAGALTLLAWPKIKTAALIGVPAALLLVGTAVVVVPWSSPPTQIRNGDFEEGLKPWWGYADPRRRHHGGDATLAEISTDGPFAGHGR